MLKLVMHEELNMPLFLRLAFAEPWGSPKEC